MRNILSALISFGVAAALSLLVTGGGPAPGLMASGQAPDTSGQAPDTSAYAWADACKDCHKPIHEAWARTKHAKALNRLSDGERRKECVKCHITGGDQMIEKRLSILNAGVQCERCHGAAAAHAADPSVRTGLVKEPGNALCRECHNERSPHFKGFVYSAMKGYVHRAPAK